MIPAAILGTFAPVTNTYNSGSNATETIPTGGASQVVIEVWGGGGAGGGTNGSPTGGASGAYVKKTFALIPSDGGKTFTYTVGASVAGGPNNGATGNTSSCVNGTYGTATNLQSGGGQGGQGAATGGTASGGDVNTAGTNADMTTTGFGAPNGGGNVGAGAAGSTPGGGGGGSNVGSGGAGAAGRAKFSYT